MEHKRLVPKRRFVGNDEKWENRKFEDLLDLSEGIRRGPFGSMLKKELFVPESNYVVYEQYNAISDKYNTRYNITQETYEDLQAFKLNTGDFIMSGAGTIGRISRVPKEIKKGVFNQALIRIRIDSKWTESEFFLQWMRSNNIQKKLTGANPASAMVNLVPMSEVKNWNVIVPCKEEQQKIGQFFKQLDEMIVTEHHKVKKIKALKAAYLAEMFPGEGELMPKRRFSGFTSGWEFKRIGDIFKVTRGNVLAATKVTKNKRKSMSYPVYSSQTLNNGLLGYYSAYLFDTAITWTTDGANAGTVNYREGKFYSTNVNGVLLSDNGYANKAVAEALNLVAWKHVSKVGNPKLMNNIMSDIVISLPSNIEELNKISRFFKQLDDKITNAERKLEKLKSTKQAYLQEMFV